MNAHFTSDPATHKKHMGDFLNLASVEITPKQIDKVPVLEQHLAPGTKVFIALLDAGDVEHQIAAAVAVRHAGFEPIPHVPARFVRDVEDLKVRIGALTSQANVKTILALGGGAPQPIGKFDSALQLMHTGVFESHGIERVGIAGHPEGNNDITKIHGEASLLAALKAKQAWIKTQNMQGFIATQFLFEAGPLALWAGNLRKEGIDLPLHVGVPGPASLKTLVRYAALCGVGNSARMIRKQALNITKLLTVSEPTEFVDQLATLHFDKPELAIAAPHLYPFGGFDKLFAWMQSQKF